MTEEQFSKFMDQAERQWFGLLFVRATICGLLFLALLVLGVMRIVPPTWYAFGLLALFCRRDLPGSPRDCGYVVECGNRIRGVSRAGPRSSAGLDGRHSRWACPCISGGLLDPARFNLAQQAPHS